MDKLHPAYLQTRQGWKTMGWKLKPDAKASGRVRLEWGTFSVYHYDQTLPITGRQARERRLDFMFLYLRGCTQRLARQWAANHPAASDEDIQDQASQCSLLWYQGVFFIEALTDTDFQNSLRPQLVLAYELAVLAACLRTYTDYTYNDF